MTSNATTSPPIPLEVLSSLTPETQACIAALSSYAPPPNARTSYGRVKQAAVLAILFERPSSSGLRVLMTTRSKALRSHPGQSALPGGKCDPEDPDPVFTARREAYEEISLPFPALLSSSSSSPEPHPSIHHLTTLAPFVSKWGLVVHPSIVFVSSPALIDALEASPAEVDRVWELPLESVLDLGYWPSREGGMEELSRKGGEDWLYKEDVYCCSDIDWREGLKYRMHRFRTAHTPIKGLSSDILIEIATIAFSRPPSFERFPAGQDRSSWEKAIESLVEESLTDGWEERRKERESKVQH